MEFFSDLEEGLSFRDFSLRPQCLQGKLPEKGHPQHRPGNHVVYRGPAKSSTYNRLQDKPRQLPPNSGHETKPIRNLASHDLIAKTAWVSIKEPYPPRKISGDFPVPPIGNVHNEPQQISSTRRSSEQHLIDICGRFVRGWAKRLCACYVQIRRTDRAFGYHSNMEL
jgi:hypothetical protein